MGNDVNGTEIGNQGHRKSKESVALQRLFMVMELLDLAPELLSGYVRKD